MANEYRASVQALEVLDEAPTAARLSALGIEAVQADEAASDIRLSVLAAEVAQADDAATRIRTTISGVEVLCSLTNAGVRDGALQIFPSLRLVLDADLDGGARMAFAGALALRLAGEKDPPFDCRAPAETAWARASVAAAAWTCSTPSPPPEPGDGDAADETLAYLDGERFADLAGDRLKLIG